MGALGIFKHIVERQSEALSNLLEKKKERVDSTIPLGIKINSIVKSTRGNLYSTRGN
jgi:hypothetical protein